MRPFTRYLLFQIPGWVAAGVLGIWIWPWTGLDRWLGVAAFACWVAKDLALFPMLRIGYEPARTGVEQLVGLRGVVSADVSPVGFVQLRGERWRAELGPGEPPIPAGAIVEVRSAAGFTLQVVRVDDE